MLLEVHRLILVMTSASWLTLVEMALCALVLLLHGVECVVVLSESLSPAY